MRAAGTGKGGITRAGAKKSRFIELRGEPGYQLPDCAEMHMSILYRDTDSAGLGSASSRENNASTVLRIEYRKYSLLFMGDLEGKGRSDPAERLSLGEALLLRNIPPGKLRADVLKVGHHGSETSSTLPLIRAVAPSVIVIQSGRKAFGGKFLPDQTVLERFRKELPGVTIVRTDEGDEAEGLDSTNDADGDDIAILTDGDSLRVRQATMVGGQRRWVTVKKIQK